MNKKKIYFLVNSLEWWGAEKVITTFAENLDKNVFDITIFTLKNVNFYNIPGNIKYIPLSKTKSNLIMLLWFLSWYYIFKFKKYVKNYDFWISFLELANFIHILAKKQAVISFRTTFNVFNKYWITWKVYNFLIKKLYPKAWKIVVNSQENKEKLSQQLDIPKEKIEVLYNPKNFEEIEKLKQENIEESLLEKIKWKEVFITVGRLVKIKRHNLILSWIKKLIEKNKNIFLIIIGDWSERFNLEGEVKKLNLQENIIFLWRQKNIFKYLNLAKYFIYASEYEGFPNVLVEAIICWLPIITTNFETGSSEVIFNDYKKIENYPSWWWNGVIINDKNFEKKLVEVYENKDKLKCEKIGIEKFESEKVLEKFCKLIR